MIIPHLPRRNLGSSLALIENRKDDKALARDDSKDMISTPVHEDIKPKLQKQR